MKLSLHKDTSDLKKQKLAEIDAGAHRAYESYRTSGEYAALVYAQKRAELSAYDADTPVSELTLLNAEANGLQIDPMALLTKWREKVSAESAALPKIEAHRQCLKRQINNAVTPAEIEAVMHSMNYSFKVDNK